MSAEQKGTVSRNSDAAPEVKQPFGSRVGSSPSSTAPGVSGAGYHGGRPVNSHQQQQHRQSGGRGNSIPPHVAPGVGGRDGGVMGSRVRTLSGDDASGSHMGGFRAQPPQGYSQPHGQPPRGYMPPQQGLPQGRHQPMQGGAGIMQGAAMGVYHGHSAPQMPMYGQPPPNQAMNMPPQMYGNPPAPTLGYPPVPVQGYYPQQGYDDRYQYGGQMSMGGGATGMQQPPGSINASHIVPPLPMDPPRQPQSQGYPYQQQQPQQQQPPPAAPVRKTVVLKDKDGNVIDLSAVKSSAATPTAAPVAKKHERSKPVLRATVPAAAAAPAVSTPVAPVPAVAAPVDSAPVVATPVVVAPTAKPEVPVAPPTADAAEDSKLTEGFGDIVIEGPPDDVDVPVPVVAPAVPAARPTKAADKTVENSKTNVDVTKSGIGVDAFSSDFVIEGPEDDEPAAPIAAVEKSTVGVQAPVEAPVTTAPTTVPASNAPRTPEPDTEDDEEDDWETSEIPDVNKLHLAAKEEKSAAADAASAQFIFPTTKSDGDSVKRNNKSSKRDKYASADAAPESSGILDAYTDNSAPVIAKVGSSSPATVPSSTSSKTPATTNSSKQTAKSSKNASKGSNSKSNSPALPVAKSTPEPVPQEVKRESPALLKFVDSTPPVEPEKKTSSLYVPPALASSPADAVSTGSTVRRSLRPGGGKTKEVLNVPGAHTNRPRLTYTKKELKDMIPDPLCDRPPVLNVYSTITIVEGSSSRQVKSVCMGGTPPASSERPSGGPAGRSGGSSADKWGKQAPPGPSAEERVAASYGAPANMNSPQQYRHHGRNKRNVPMPMPKKQYDQLEKYGRDVQAILNKISPGNFQKLIVELCKIPCVDAVMMEKLITLIFEKSLQEPSFSKMYADMCYYIEYQSPHILCNFFYVVHYEATLQYRWVKDLKLPTDFTGPFGTEGECLDAMSTAELPKMNHVLAGPLVHFSLTLRGDYLIQVAKIVDRDSYYTNRIVLEDIDSSTFSERFFGSVDAATKDYIKKNGFRWNLVTTCQNEFLASVDMSSRYHEGVEREQAFEVNKGRMSEDEKQLEALEIEELNGKLKRRMLGNIRFIGELFKSNILKESTVFSCIDRLMLASDEETGVQSWNFMDERSIEILCKLLTTVGEDVKHQDKLDQYFARMQDLSVDKALNSRMRFMLFEVIDLRRHNWTGREATAEKNAYVGGFIHTILPEQTAVVRHINNMPGGLASNDVSGSTRSNRSGSASATSSPVDARAASSTQSSGLSSSIAPTLFSNPPSAGSTPVRQGSPSIPLAPVVGSPNLSNRGSPSVASGKGSRRPSAGSFDATNWRAPSPITATSAVPPSGVVTPLVTRRKISVAGSLDDYFSLDPETPDAMSCVDDLKQCSVKEVVSKVLEDALESKHAKLPSIIKLLELLCPHLSTSSADCHAAVAALEPLQMLGDTVLDCKEAPERLGEIVRVLISGGACDAATIKSMVSSFRKTSLEDEYAAPDVVNSAFSRFLAAAAI